MSEVTLTCEVCLTTITLRQTETLSSRVIDFHFRAQGWDEGDPVACPEHKGVAGQLRVWAARLSRAQCPDEHDWDYMLGDVIAPHEVFCQVARHYWWWPVSAGKLMVPRNT